MPLDCQNEQENFTLCPKFEKTFSLLGKKWNGLVIDVFLSEGTQRFAELAKKIPELSDRVLTERLKELEAAGLIVREEKEKNRTYYHLTTKGEDLASVMDEIHRWAEKWQ